MKQSIPRGEIKMVHNKKMRQSKTNHMKDNKVHSHLAKPQAKQFEQVQLKKEQKAKTAQMAMLTRHKESQVASQVRAIR